jgi:hypothetical protein
VVLPEPGAGSAFDPAAFVRSLEARGVALAEAERYIADMGFAAWDDAEEAARYAFKFAARRA